MNCNNVDNYINKINNVSEHELEQIYKHADECRSCKVKLGFEDEISLKLSEHFDSITPSFNLIRNIDNISINQNYKLKPVLLAACLAFLLGIGIFIERTALGIPNVSEIHSLDSFNVISSNIQDIANYLEVELNDSHFIHFDAKGYSPHGATKISKSLKGSVKLIALKNKESNKLSLCFLPRSYNLPYHNKTEVKDVQIHHGKSDSHHFIFWQGNKNTIVLISPNVVTHEELINFAYHLIGEV